MLGSTPPSLFTWLTRFNDLTLTINLTIRLETFFEYKLNGLIFVAHDPRFVGQIDGQS